MQQAAAVPLSPGRADKWLWKDKREELGSLIHVSTVAVALDPHEGSVADRDWFLSTWGSLSQYIAASDTHSLPALDPKKPIDPRTSSRRRLPSDALNSE